MTVAIIRYENPEEVDLCHQAKGLYSLSDKVTVLNKFTWKYWFVGK